MLERKENALNDTKIGRHDMDGKEKCDHCDGSGMCNKGIHNNASCSDCCEASGLDMGYYKGQAPCAVCKGKKGKKVILE
jgi:hypothetical protein